MSIPPLSAHLKVNADHSCNWKCCFGCKEQTPEESPKSEIIEETVHKVTVIHRHTPHNTPRVSMDDKYPRSLEGRCVDKSAHQ
jgi:hypothetical protein